MKRILVILSLVLCQFSGLSQNWQSIGSSFSGPVNFLYCDTVTSSLIALGPFLSADTSTCYGIARWDGSQWVPYLSTTGNYPRCITNFQGEYYITGTSTDGLFKWSGTNWIEVGAVDNGLSFVSAIYNDGDSALYALGRFDSIGGIASTGIAKYDGTSWSRVGTTNFLGTVTCAIRFQGKLYAGGNFQNTSGSIQNIAVWDGLTWSAVGSGIDGSFETVNALTVYNSELLVGGYFQLSSGDPGEFIARWDGTTWTQVGGGVSNGQVLTMAVYGSAVWVGGQFNQAGGIPSFYLSRWDGTDWCSVGVFDNIVPSIATDGDSLYVGGNFTTIDANPVNNVVAWIGGNFSDSCGHLNTSINSLSISTDIIVFPNPASDVITFQFSDDQQSRELIIYDALGKEVWREESDAFSFVISIQEFPEGIYFYSVGGENGKNVRGKFLVQ